MRQVKAEIETLFRAYYRPLCLYALHFIGDADQVEDIVHDCYIELMNRLMRGQEIKNRKAYLYTLVRNSSLAYMKKASKTVSIDTIADVESDVEELEADSYAQAHIWRKIDELPSACREIFLMSKRDGLKYSEIAKELNISIKTVENQISKAYRKLKEGAIKIYNFLFL